MQIAYNALHSIIPKTISSRVRVFDELKKIERSTGGNKEIKKIKVKRILFFIVHLCIIANALQF